MKKFKKILALFTTAVMATSTLTTSVFATGDTAYCVGIDYYHTSSSGSTTTGNFKTNAQNAKAKQNIIALAP